MTSVFLGDSFSLDEPSYLGRPIANRALLRAIFACEQIDHVVAVGDPRPYQSLGLGEAACRKLAFVNSVVDLVDAFSRHGVAAIFCSAFGKKFAQLVHFRNINNLQCPVFGLTHTLSYQDEVGAIYRMMCAGARACDGLLCTSHVAMGVMERLMDSVKATLSFECDGPSLHHFPLSYEAGGEPVFVAKSNVWFQVLYFGRLDWQTKADLLVLPALIAALPADHDIHFVVAGATGNPDYLSLLQKACTGLPVRFEVNVSDTRRNQLYGESHVFFSPSDNYQETFGLSVLEAKHHGCVPVVSDFNGYRDLVSDGEDGFLLRTYAAGIPNLLWKTQILMPDPVYHGWWAAGVTIDPAEAAALIQELSRDRAKWEVLSRKAVESVKAFSIRNTAARFGALVSGGPHAARDTISRGSDQSPPPNPFHIDYSKLFVEHPSGYWADEPLILTARGLRFLQLPDPAAVHQVRLLNGAVSGSHVEEFLALVKAGCSASECRSKGVAPIVMSVALKNGLVSVATSRRVAEKVQSGARRPGS